MGRDMFDLLVRILSQHTIFQSKGRKPQRPVKWQLAAFLLRYGHRGSDVLDVSIRIGIGVGSVHNYCRRVTRVLREIRGYYVRWPDNDRKDEISQSIYESSLLEKCLGAVDGCHIRLAEEPAEDGEQFRARKKCFAVELVPLLVFACVNLTEKEKTAVQATVDKDLNFTTYEHGWPASVTDVRIFKNSHLWMNRMDYFNDGEYILADKGTHLDSWQSKYMLNTPSSVRLYDFPLYCPPI